MPKTVVVVGAGLGGLSAAIHARLAGHSVLVIDQRECVGGKAAGHRVQGYRLDPGPSIIILPRIYEQVFCQAGRKMEDYLQFDRLDPITRVFFEGRDPVDLPADSEECLSTLSDVAPRDSASIRALMAKVRSISPWVDKTIFGHPYHAAIQLLDPKLIRIGFQFDLRKTYKQLVDGMFESPLLRAFFYGFPSYGGQSYAAKSIGGFMIPYLMLEEGVWYPKGGVSAIPLAFERLARELGVEFRFGARACGFRTAKGRVLAIEVAGGEEIETEAAICNADRNQVAPWLGRAVPSEPSFSYFTLHWGIRKKMLDLSHHNLLIPANFEAGFRELYAEQRFPHEPIVYLNETSQTEASVAPDGCSNLFAVVTSPAMVSGINWKHDQSEYRSRTMRMMAQFGIDPSPVEFEEVQTPETFESRDGSFRGSLYGLEEKHRLWGLFPARVCDEEYRNLFYCGGSVQPGAGLPMVTLSGRFAAELLDRN